MTKTAQAYLTVGKIGSTFGIKGWLKIQSFTEFGASILDFKPWFLSIDGTQWKEAEIEHTQTHAKKVLVKFKGIDTPEKARLLTGQYIGIIREQLPSLPKNEYYWSDLEGLTVIDQHDQVLGTVLYLLSTGANDVLIVKGTKEHAIPYLPGQVIKEVDLGQKIIRVDWELL